MRRLHTMTLRDRVVHESGDGEIRYSASNLVKGDVLTTTEPLLNSSLQLK